MSVSPLQEREGDLEGGGGEINFVGFRTWYNGRYFYNSACFFYELLSCPINDTENSSSSKTVGTFRTRFTTQCATQHDCPEGEFSTNTE